MDKKKLIPIVLLLITAAGAAYFFLGKGSDAPGKPPKVTGVSLPLGDELLLNLKEERYAKVNISLLLDKDDPAAKAMAEAGEGAEGASAAPPAPHPQDSVIRSVIVNDLSNINAEQLLNRAHRKELLAKVKKDINSQTDAKVQAVLVTGLTVD